MSPTTGTAGVTGCAVTSAEADNTEVQPTELVTVKGWKPGVRPVTVTLLPLPVILPGFTVQVPEGRLFNTTLPVDTVQVGCVTVPIVGADGVTGCTLIVKLDENTETQPSELVTV